MLRRDSNVAKTKPDSGEKLFRVLPRQVDQTISAALREWLPGQSWSEVRRLLKSRRVTINGNLCVDAGRRLRLTDVVKVLPQSLAPPPDELDVRIVYLDKHVVVVEKPSGMTTTRHSEEQDMSPRRRQLQPTLDELLPRAIAKIEARGAKNAQGKKARGRACGKSGAVHRLDRDTSGLLVFARTAGGPKTPGAPISHAQHPATIPGGRPRRRRVADDREPAGSRSRRRPPREHDAAERRPPRGDARSHGRAARRLHADRMPPGNRANAPDPHPSLRERTSAVRRQGLRPAVVSRRQPDTSGAPRLALCAVELGFVHPVTGEPMHFESPAAARFHRIRAAITLGRETDKTTSVGYASASRGRHPAA